jgi:hypothetical protein
MLWIRCLEYQNETRVRSNSTEIIKPLLYYESYEWISLLTKFLSMAVPPDINHSMLCFPSKGTDVNVDHCFTMRLAVVV